MSSFSTTQDGRLYIRGSPISHANRANVVQALIDHDRAVKAGEFKSPSFLGQSSESKWAELKRRFPAGGNRSTAERYMATYTAAVADAATLLGDDAEDVVLHTIGMDALKPRTERERQKSFESDLINNTLKRIIKDHPTGLLHEIAAKVEEFTGIYLDKSNICRRLKNLGISRKKLR